MLSACRRELEFAREQSRGAHGAVTIRSWENRLCLPRCAACSTHGCLALPGCCLSSLQGPVVSVCDSISTLLPALLGFDKGTKAWCEPNRAGAFSTQVEPCKLWECSPGLGTAPVLHPLMWVRRIRGTNLDSHGFILME